MNRREAKRQVCLQIGREIFERVEQISGGDADTDRIREASYDLAAELLRRGGAEREAQKVDERQMSIFEVEGVSHHDYVVVGDG